LQITNQAVCSRKGALRAHQINADKHFDGTLKKEGKGGEGGKVKSFCPSRTGSHLFGGCRANIYDIFEARSDWEAIRLSKEG